MRAYRPPRFHRHQSAAPVEDPEMEIKLIISNLHLHIEPAPEVLARLDEIATKLDLTKEDIMIDTTALVGAAQRVKQDNADLLAVLKTVRDSNVTIAATLKDVQAQLAASSGDTSAQEAAIAGVVTDLTKVADDTEAAVKANPGVPDLPPAAPLPEVT